MSNLVFFIVPIVAIALLKAYLSSPSVVGKRGEKRVARRLGSRLNSLEYKTFNDLVVPTFNGSTQVDHVVVSRFGIFVIETKNFQGWIFGTESQPTWTQTIYRKSSKFQNPLRQNYKHVKALAEYLGINEKAFHSIVVFSSSSCRLKTMFPPNVLKLKDLIPYIKRFNQLALTDEDVLSAQERLSELSLRTTKEVEKEHLAHLRSRKSLSEGNVCPQCGGRLVKRVAKVGDNKGKAFLGCSNYPRCQFIQ